MECVYIQKNSYVEAFEDLKRKLKERTVDLRKKHYVIVPDNFTLHTEKLLFSGGGAFDAGVYTFNRLFSLFAGAENYLPRHGAVMLLKKVITENADKLKFFSRSALFSGFAEKLYDTIHMLVNCKIAPQDLCTGREIDLKLSDISLLYAEYLKAAQGKYVDAAGRMALLEEYAATADFSNTHFYFTGFDGFTKQESAIIALLCNSAAGVTVYNISQFNLSFGEAEFYRSSDAADRLKAAAKRIRAAVKEQNLSYGDIGIIAPPSIYLTAKRILSEFDIPFYIDRKMNVGQQPLSQFLELLFKIAERGYMFADIIALSKNYFSGIDKPDADIFENYCLKYCVDYDRFYAAFNYVISAPPDFFSEGEKHGRRLKEEAAAEKVRQKICAFIAGFKKEYKKFMTAEEFLSLIGHLLTEADAKARCELLSDICGTDMNSVPEKILSCASLMKKIYPFNSVAAKDLLRMLSEGLLASTVSLIPKKRDAVNIGDANVFRAGGVKYLFVMDFCEGEIPPYVKDCALISDPDIDILSSCGVEIEPKISRINARYADDFFFAAAAAPKLFLAYSDTGDKRLSSAAAVIEKYAKKVFKNSIEDENEFLYSYKDEPSVQQQARIARHCSSAGNSLEMLLISLADVNDGAKGLPFASELAAAAGQESVSKFLGIAKGRSPVLEKSEELFFRKGFTSITALQDYFFCPQYNFLKNGLVLSERKDGRLTPVDIGTLLHEAVEKFVKNKRYDDPAAEMKRIVDSIVESSQTYALEANKGLIKRAMAEAEKIAGVLAAQIEASQFVPSYFEESFGYGEKDKFKTVYLNAGGREIAVRGKIDRIDTCRGYARIIDYKTGRPQSAEFDFKKAYFGRQLQLLIYMSVLNLNGYKTGGLYYFPCSVSWDDDEYSHRLSGLTNLAAEVILASDRALEEPGVKSRIINARRKKGQAEDEDGCFLGAGLFDARQLSGFCDYAVKISQTAAGEILSGFIKPSPYENGCSFCAFKSACNASDKDKKMRNPYKVKAENILSVFNENAEGGGDF